MKSACGVGWGMSRAAGMSIVRTTGVGMADAGCMWGQCNRSSMLAVSVARPGRGRSLRGAFCVPHAALASRTLRADSEIEVWLDWARSVDDERARPALHYSPRIVRRESGRHGASGVPRLRRGAGEADPLGAT